MGLLTKAANKLSTSGEQENLGKIASDTAVDIIKKMSGKGEMGKSSVVDNFIVFSNASGGTGASTLASNVSYALAQNGFKVLLIDLNILYPIQHVYLGIKQTTENKPDLVSYLLGRTTLGESIDSSNKYSLLYSNNRTLSDSINCDSDIALTNFTEMISKLRNLFDVIIVDVPMDIEKTLFNHVLYSCDTMYIVWDEGMSAMSNTEKIRRHMAFCGIDSYTKMKVILNKRTNIRYDSFPLKKMNLELVGVLPFDTAIIESSTRGEIFCEKGSSNHKNAIEFERAVYEIADKILKIGGLTNMGN